MDVEITHHGSICLFRPVSTEARDFFDDRLSGGEYQWFGGALAVEPRYADNIAIALATEGFVVDAL